MLEYVEGSVHLRQAQCLFNSVSLSCPAESSHAEETYQIRSTAHRIPPWCTCSCTIKLIRGVHYIPSPWWCTYSRPNSLKRAALSTEIVGMAGGIRDAIKFWTGAQTILLARLRRQENDPEDHPGKRLCIPKNHTQAEKKRNPAR